MAYNKETKMYEGYIYCITNNVTGKKYIGQTFRTIEIRLKEHINNNYTKNNTYIHNSIIKYGHENFNIDIIEKLVIKDKSELNKLLNDKEIYYIVLYKTITPNGYNVSKGGSDCGYTFNEKEVCQYDLYGNYIQSFVSISECARSLGCNKSDITRCCKGKLKSVKDYVFCYKEENIDISNMTHKKPVVQLDLNYNIIQHFNSAVDASKYTKIPIGIVRNSCYHNYINFDYGFLFVFYNNLNNILVNKNINNIKLNNKKYILNE